MNDVLDKLARRSAATLRAVTNPVLYRKTVDARQLEAQGFEAWLRTLGSRTFTGSFSGFHRELWTWYWRITLKRLRHEPLTTDELAFLAIWFRGGGKSANIEWACIAEGALLGEGFVMYLCNTEGQAKEHVAAIRKRLESSEIGPGLARPEVGKHGFRVGWRQDYLATASGWGIIPVGLDQGIRGGRKDDLRFTMIVLDDIDDVTDSPAVVQKKLDIISRSILPAGQRDTLVLFAQNLIHEDSVLNQIVMRRSDVLSERVVSGPVPAFEELELEMKGGGHGPTWQIKSCEPTWPDIDMEAARRYLARSGRASFLAEYQHDFAADREELVLSNWRDDVHVITWSEFEGVFGVRSIPARWYKYAFHDWARTKSQYHANVAGFVTVSSQNEPLPGFVFLYNCLSFDAGTEADDVGLELVKTVAPGGAPGGGKWDDLVKAALSRAGLERYVTDATELMAVRRTAMANVIPRLVQPILTAQHYVRWRMSHEALSARNLYRTVYGLPFQPANPGKDGGVEMLHHFMQVDEGADHLFKPHHTGFSRFFLIVDDDRAAYPTGLLPDKLHGSDLARYQFKHWRNRAVRLTEGGIVEHGPTKMNDDFGNGLMMLFHDNCVKAAPMTEGERREAKLPEYLRAANIATLTDIAEQHRASAQRHFMLLDEDEETEAESLEKTKSFYMGGMYGRR